MVLLHLRTYTGIRYIKYWGESTAVPGRIERCRSVVGAAICTGAAVSGSHGGLL